MWMDDYIKEREEFEDKLRYMSSKEFINMVPDAIKEEVDDEFRIIFGPSRGKLVKIFGNNISLNSGKTV